MAKKEQSTNEKKYRVYSNDERAHKKDVNLLIDKVLWDSCEPISKYGGVKKEFMESFQSGKKDGNLINAEEHHLPYRRDPIWRTYMNAVVIFVTDKDSNQSAVILGEYMWFKNKGGAGAEDIVNRIHKKHKSALESKLRTEFKYAGPIEFFGEEE